jgi:hypothetical protein
MIKCGGCGRDVDPTGLYTGNKYLCVHCYHLQIAGQEPMFARSNIVFLAITLSMVAAIALAGLALCLLYLSGTGKVAWFVLLLALMICVVACPIAILFRTRNLTILITSIYLPFGIWSFIIYIAPGVHWEFSKVTVWSALCFLGIGILSLYLFLRDLKILPRL